MAGLLPALPAPATAALSLLVQNRSLPVLNPCVYLTHVQGYEKCYTHTKRANNFLALIANTKVSFSILSFELSSGYYIAVASMLFGWLVAVLKPIMTAAFVDRHRLSVSQVLDPGRVQAVPRLPGSAV